MRISDWSSDVCSSDLGNALGHERGGDAVQIGAGNMRVGDDHRAPAVQERRDLRADIGEQSVADQDIIASRAQFDGQPFHCVSASRIARTRSEEHTSELQSLMRISYAVLCLTKTK